MKPIDRGCLCKRRYESKDLAEAAIVEINAIVPLRAYRCIYGKHWHLTKAPLREVLVRRLKNAP